MTTPSSGPGGFGNKEANLGGADATSKTTYGAGGGTEPEGPPSSEKRVTASVGSGGGFGIGGLALAVIVLAVIAYFGFAFFK